MSACNSNSQISNYVASISGIILGRQGELKFCYIESSHEGQEPWTEALRAPGTRSDEGDDAVGVSTAQRWYRARFNTVPRFFWQITLNFMRVCERPRLGQDVWVFLGQSGISLLSGGAARLKAARGGAEDVLTFQDALGQEAGRPDVSLVNSFALQAGLLPRQPLLVLGE